ncbi:MAG: DUF1365 domain-containing protein [Pseudomonadota bacterium]
MRERSQYDHRLYVGEVMHMRLQPCRHKFTYRVFTSLLDIDRLESAKSRLLAINGFGLFSFNEKDHGPRDGSPLRPWVEDLLEQAGRPAPAKIMILSMPRFLGWVFNPLSVYFCYDAFGALESIVYEVKNTFGDQVPYVQSANADPDGTIRHKQAKEMFVSPFIEMEQTYRFTLRNPDDRLALRIRQAGADGETLIATQTGERVELSDFSLAKLSLSHPLAAFKIIAAIHWQALKLWLKGAPFRRYPGSDDAFAYNEKPEIAASS